MKRLLAIFFASCVGIAGGALAVHAQVINGTIVGTAYDPSGAVVPGAHVTLTNVGTQYVRTETTDAAGNYVFAELPPGIYSISAEASGMQTAVIKQITLQVSQGTRADLHFTIGSTAQQVVVTAPTVMLDTQTSSVGEVIGEQTIVSLPLNGRDYLQLATLTAGVQSGSGDVGSTRGLQGVDISGGRHDETSFLIDGTDTTLLQLGNVAIFVSPDAIQEFKVLENNFDARYGQASGVVSTSIKSGSNAFHGSAYEFIRNNHLDANPFFDNYSGIKLPQYKQNQFGGSSGGRIIQNKLFFFGNYEGLRIRQGNLIQAVVPTQAELSGNLSAYSTPIINPLTGTPFPNNQVPVSQAAKVFNPYFPAPNAALANGTNYITAPSTVRNDNQFTARIDYNLSSRDTLFGEEVYYQSSDFIPSTIPLEGATDPQDGQVFNLQETHSMGPNAVNVARLSYSRGIGRVAWVQTPTDVNAAMGVANLPNIASLNGLPDMVIGGFTTIGGYPFYGGGKQNVFTGSDEFSLVHGRHQLTFGTDIRRIQFQFPAASFFNGLYEFEGYYTGNALADYLLGYPYVGEAQQIPDFDNFRQSRISFYAQDNLRATTRLTLNMGVRYEYDQPTYEANNKEGYFDNNLQKLVVRVPSTYPGPPIPSSEIDYDPGFQRGIWHPQYLNFAPRLGFAYLLPHNTVLRGGYGIFFTQTEGNQLEGKSDILPFAYTAEVIGNAPSSPAPPQYTMSTLFPSLASQAQGGILSPYTVNPKDDRPYDQEWNFGIQHRFSSSILADISYVGDKGSHLVERTVDNQAFLPPSPTDITPIQSRRPLPNWGDILDFGYGEASNYNALQIRVEKRMTSGLSFLAGYTWSHELDSSTASDSGFATTHQNSYDLAEDYGTGDNSLPQRFTFSYTYLLPFGRGSHFLSGVNSPVNRLVSGWQVLGITTFATGEGQSSITVNGDRSNTGADINRANEVAGCADNGNLPKGQRKIAEWFNTSCFAPNALGTFGNSGRNIIKLPGTNNWDMSMIKDTPITERLKAQFRAEFFSAFNHPNFTAPTLNVQSPQFGEVLGAGDSRQIQFAVKFLW